MSDPSHPDSGRDAGPPSPETLRALLPRSLLLEIYTLGMPSSPPDEPVPFSSAIAGQSFDAYVPSLAALAVWTPAAFASIDFLDPDLGVLPDPTDPAFPKYALGLILLFDQGARKTMPGVDQRYVNGYFDPLVNKLAVQLTRLPPSLSPFNKDRWTRPVGEGGLGLHLTHFLFALFFLMAPITHWESVECQDYQVSLLGWGKRWLAEETGVPDPYASKLAGALDKDTYAFAREIKAGGPTDWEQQVPARLGLEAPYTLIGGSNGEKYHFYDWFYWFAMIAHVHRPIIQRFGRFPYRNAALGRESTKAELEWLVRTEHFGEVGPDVAKLIRQDVKNGIWRELQAGKKA